MPEKPFGVFRVERRSPGVGRARSFRIAQPGNGTEVAVSNCCFLPVLFSAHSLVFGEGF